MKIVHLPLLAFLMVLASGLKAQINVISFKVQDQYLKDGKISIKSNSPTTVIKIEVEFTASRDNQGNPKPASTKTRVVTSSANGQTVYLSEQQEIKHTDFKKDELILKKTYDISIEKSKLADRIIGLFVKKDSFAEGLYASKSYNYVIESVPTETEISNNEIQIFGDPEAVDKIHLKGLQPFGGNGTYSVSWHIVDADGTPITNAQGVQSSLLEWIKNDVSYPVINSQKAVYVYRRVTSGSKISNSNSVMIIGNEILNNIISLQTSLSNVDNYSVEGAIATGSGQITAIWKTINTNGTFIDNIDGITSSTNIWTKDNVNFVPIKNVGEVYLYRILSSRRRKSESNKILISNWNGNFSTKTIKIRGRLAKYDASNNRAVLMPKGTEINANELASYAHDAILVNDDIILIPSLEEKITLTMENPTPGVTYRWHYIMEGMAHIGFEGWYLDGPGLIGTSVIADSLPRSGTNNNQVHIYGSDGSRQIVYLTTHNYTGE